MAAIGEKIAGVREKISGALEDVPDTLIGTIVFLVVLTALGLGGLLLVGFWATNF